MPGSAAGGDIRLCKTKFSVTIARFYCCGSFYHNSENGDNRSENEIQTLCSLGPTNVESCPQTSLVKHQDGEEERSHPEEYLVVSSAAVALFQDLPVYKLTVNQITPDAASCHAGGCLERVNEMGDILQSRIRSYATVGW